MNSLDICEERSQCFQPDLIQHPHAQGVSKFLYVSVWKRDAVVAGGFDVIVSQFVELAAAGVGAVAVVVFAPLMTDNAGFDDSYVIAGAVGGAAKKFADGQPMVW